MFSKVFIDRPIFASVISIVIMIVGGVALVSLPVARYPDIAPPTIVVDAFYPGANALTVAETVAAPIEQEVNGVEGMLYCSSTSAGNGSMSLTVTFEVGTDLDTANVLVQNRVQVAMSKLPEEVKRQGVQVKKQSADTTAFIALYSPDQRYDGLFLNNYANLFLKDELARVAGVGNLEVYGAGDYAMRIWLDPEQLLVRGLTTTDVVNAIGAQNVQVAAGQIGKPPAPEGLAYQFTVTTRGRLTDPEEFGSIIIRRSENGGLVRVRDVARVELGSKEYGIDARLDGVAATAIAINQVPGANAIGVLDGVRATMERLSVAFPEGLEYSIVYDSTDVIRSSIAEVVETLFITLALVVLTVWIFLQNFRATLIPTATIPVSLIGTFAVMALLGFSINQLTLFGLVLVIGIVVDDAIVVVENVTRHLDETGLPPKEAAIEAMREVSGPVVATTLVLLAVFVPTAFMGGITGQLFQQFAVTIAIATVFSSINALTLSPALAGVLMRKSPERRMFLFRWFNALLDRGTGIYVGLVRGAIRVSVITCIIFVGFVAAGIWGLGQLPTGFVPQEDEGWCIVNVQLPDAASLERTEAVLEQVEAIVRDTPGVKAVLSILGYSVVNSSAASNSATAIVTYEHWDARTAPEVSQDAIVGGMNRRFAGIQEALVMAFTPPSLPGLGNSGGFALQLQDRGGIGPRALAQVATEFVNDGNTQSALRGVYCGFRADVPQLWLEIDREQVMSLDIPMSEVFATLQAFLGSAYVNDFIAFGRIFQVSVQADSQFRARPEDIELLEVRSRSGTMIPLGTVLEVREEFGPEVVYRHNVYPCAKISGGPGPGYSSGQAMQILESMADTKLPTTMGYAWTELSFQEKLATGGAGAIFLFSVILVYLVLAAQYESWTIPVSVCLSVPIALVGAVAGLYWCGMDNNVYTQIGIVLLIGLSAKSSILIVEFAKVKREEGLSVVDAAISAAHLRFRAVLMTALSFILGVIPLLVASGAGSASRQVIGVTVFSGMLVGTCVSVVVVPMLFRIIQGFSESIRGVKSTTPAE